MRRRQIRAIVSASEIDRVNKILERQGLGPNYIDTPITTKTGTRVTRKAVESLVDNPEYAAIQLALKHVPETRKVVEVEKVDVRKKRVKKMDKLLARKGWKRKAITIKEKKL